MNVNELNREQLTQLKTRYYDDLHPEGVSYYEYANIDNLVSDAEIMEAYSDTCFVEEDFSGEGDQ